MRNPEVRRWRRRLRRVRARLARTVGALRARLRQQSAWGALSASRWLSMGQRTRVEGRPGSAPVQPGCVARRSATRPALGLAAALAVALLVGSALGRWSPATAQPATPDADPRVFTATGYAIWNDVFWEYFQRRGGVRTFGYPVSNEFQLLGKRVQLFQRQVLALEADGSARPLNLLDDLLPITRVNGSTFPEADPELTAFLPPPGAEGYLDQVLDYVARTAPDRWNGLPVNFGATFRGTVSCEEAFGTGACPERVLAALALEVWGLPTSRPAFDPTNGDVVYQRFQRGVMEFRRGTGATGGLLLGDWFKQVLLGTDLPPDLALQVAGSTFLAQYAPFDPLGLARPSDLPGSVLAGAFGAEALGLVRQGSAQPAATATPASLPTSTPTPGPASTPTLGADVSTAGCAGDEQMFFVPRRPLVGTDVVVAVTSARRHDVRWVRLTGPVKTGTPTERPIPGGWAWEWTLAPAAEGWYELTFYADGLTPCIVSGFNAQPPLGATPTPTATPELTETPTPTSTAFPRPAISGIAPTSGACGQFARVTGSNFGTTGQVYFIGGGATWLATVVSWTDTEVTITTPNTLSPPTTPTPGPTSTPGATPTPTATPTAGPTITSYDVVVATAGGSSGAVAYTVAAGSGCF